LYFAVLKYLWIPKKAKKVLIKKEDLLTQAEVVLAKKKSIDTKYLHVRGTIMIML